MTLYIIGLVAWVAVGSIVGVDQLRRGHWPGRLVICALLGPLAIPLANQEKQYEDAMGRATVLSEGTVENVHGLRVLIGVDGSDASVAAAREAARVLGVRIGAITLATVADYETGSSPTGAIDAHALDARKALALVESAALSLEEWLGFTAQTVLLRGRPSEALVRHAENEGFDVLVVGTRGRGLSKHLLGSCAADLAASSAVPVFIVPSSGLLTGTEDAGA